MDGWIFAHLSEQKKCWHERLGRGGRGFGNDLTCLVLRLNRNVEEA